jgi:hypothetical protein
LGREGAACRIVAAVARGGCVDEIARRRARCVVGYVLSGLHTKSPTIAEHATTGDLGKLLI